MPTEKLLPKSRKFAGKKKLFLPLLLIFLFVVVFVFGVSQKGDLSFKLQLGPRSMIEPLPPTTREEKLRISLANIGLSVESLNFEEEKITASVSGGLTIFFLPSKDLSRQVASLQFILSRAKIEGKNPKRIDLRFENPILEFN